MAWKVFKFPCPNAQQFVVQVPGMVLDCLHFQAQIMRQSNILDSQGKGKANMILSVWCLIEEDADDEAHGFVMVQPGVEIPQVDAELYHVGTTYLLLPTGENLEFTLFHCGKVDIDQSRDVLVGETREPS